MAVIRNPAQRDYLRRFVPMMIAYAVLCFAAPALISATGARGPVLWVIAVLPALPVIGVFWIIGQLFLKLRDEYVRMLEVRKALVATGLTLSLTTAWGFLEIYARAPHIPTFYVAVIWFAGLGVGGLVNQLIERDSAA